MSDIGIVIQGPTNYCDQILDNIDTSFDYVWSTWESEPEENLKKIRDKIKLVTGPTPDFGGVGNLNFQALSTYRGVESLSNPWIVKMRGDLLWTGQEELITNSIKDIQDKENFAGFLSYKPSIQEVHDFVSISSRENALSLWSYRQEHPDSRRPEHQLADHISNLLGLSYDDMVKRQTFINLFMEEGKFDIFCIKYNVSLGWQCNIDWGGVRQFPKKK